MKTSKYQHNIPYRLPDGSVNLDYKNFYYRQRRLKGGRAKAVCAECGKVEFGLGWARRGHFLQRRDSQHRCLAKVYVCGECWPEPTERPTFSQKMERQAWKREHPVPFVPLRRAYNVPAPDPQRTAERQREVDALLDTLGDRERAILVARFLHNRTLEDVGGDWGLTRERVRQIENIALCRLRKRKSFIENKL